MGDKIKFLTAIGYDRETMFELDEVTFENCDGKKLLVFHHNEIMDYSIYYLKQELPHLPIQFLKPIINISYRFDYIIEELKELSLFDPDIILDKITLDKNILWLEILKYKGIEIEEIFFNECEILRHHMFSTLIGVREC